jgi:hypothetical protein
VQIISSASPQTMTACGEPCSRSGDEDAVARRRANSEVICIARLYAQLLARRKPTATAQSTL